MTINLNHRKLLGFRILASATGARRSATGKPTIQTGVKLGQKRGTKGDRPHWGGIGTKLGVKNA